MTKEHRSHTFTVVLDDGQEVRGYGKFDGGITAADREAIAGVVRCLKRLTHAEKIESVFLTKPSP